MIQALELFGKNDGAKSNYKDVTSLQEVFISLIMSNQALLNLLDGKSQAVNDASDCLSDTLRHLKSACKDYLDKEGYQSLKYLYTMFVVLENNNCIKVSKIK